MSLFKRVLRSISRNQQKTILLLLIFLIIGNAMAVAIAISIGTNNVERQIKQRLGAVVKIGPDHAYWERVHAEANKQPGGIVVPQEQIALTGNSGQVRTFYEYPEVELEDKIAFIRESTQQMMASNMVKAYDYSVVATAGSAHLLLAGQDLLPPEHHDPHEMYILEFTSGEPSMVRCKC